ncbi:MAG: serine protease [Deltaproteobacteria bacterium]|jgi:S1-C subfamily serine protease|nr:serine protease [Deltaproteobacteria bacterium]
MQSIVLNVTTFSAFQIDLKFNDIVLATGTAFFTSAGKRVLLVTNKHNVTGRNSETGECLEKHAAVPNIMSVLIPITSPKKEGFICSHWQRYDIPLYINGDEERPAWVEHPDSLVDLVGFKFNPPEINIKNLVLPADGTDLPMQVCNRVNVIGYPFGVSTDNFPIWSTGYIASEPTIDVNGKPLLYIDSRTRQGQSGSPVVRFFHPGETVYMDGNSYMAKKPQVYLLGIYSGRIRRESDIGMVWKKKAIIELFESAENTKI